MTEADWFSGTNDLTKSEPVRNSTSQPETPSTDTQPIYFLHIPKTAGVSMRVLLSSALDDSLCPYRDWDELFAAGGRLLRHYNAYSGHYGIGLASFLGIPLRTFTLLRDPIALTVSNYLHVRRHPDHPYHAVVINQSLMEYVCSPLTAHRVFNFQARYLTGGRINLADLAKRFDINPDKSKSLAVAWEQATFAMDTEQIREEAIETFRRLEYVGLTDEFDRSLQGIARCFGFQPVASERLNVAPEGSKTGLLDAETEQLIRERTAIDQELIEMARRRLAGEPTAVTAGRNAAETGPLELNRIDDRANTRDLASELKATRAEALAMAKHRDELKRISDDTARHLQNAKARADYLRRSRDEAIAFAKSEHAHARTVSGNAAEAMQYAHSLEEALNEAKSQASLERKAREQLEANVREEVARHEAKIRSIETYVASLRATIAARDEQIREAQRYVESLEAAVAARYATFQKAEEYAKSLESFLNEQGAQRHLASLEAALRQYDSAMQEAQQHVDSLLAFLAQHDTALRDTQEHAGSLTAKLEHQMVALHEAKLRLASLRALLDQRIAASSGELR